MQLIENFPLAKYSTFYIGGPSRYLIYVTDLTELQEAVAFAKSKELPFFILGEGSNLLISDKGYKGVVIKMELLGIDLISEDEDSVMLKIASGENWDDVVRFAVEENWWGIENLSHIPGTMGAFSVQNVGAYGQEASQVVSEVEVLEINTNTIKVLTAAELNFSYRKSIFNTTQKNKYIILTTTIRLSKNPEPKLDYGDLKTEFAETEKAGNPPTISAIRSAIVKIRNTKFPYPDTPTQGNSGSFFRGPILSESELESLAGNLKQNFSADCFSRLLQMKDRLQVPQGYKTPAAFLIELCGLKDFSVGGAKINPSQPAIILNFTGRATSTDVLELYKTVSLAVLEKTSVRLGIEPELLGFSDEELTYFSVKK